MILNLCTANDDHMFGSWDIEHDRQNFLPFRAILCPFTPITTQKIKILKIWKKTPGGLIILNMSTINENHIMYESWDMEHDRQNFFSFWTIFCPFTPPPPNNPENQNFEKMKKNDVDIIILHKCTINDNHMIYGSWDMKCNRLNFLSSWAIFCSFSPLTARKMKISQKWKNHLEISSFNTSAPKIKILCFTVP